MEIAISATAPAKGRLVWADRTVVCTLGHGGIRAVKREGDGATPAGLFPLRRVLWRADRMADPPVTRLPCAPIAPTDGWCDWPDDPFYNRPVTLPYPARHERMWRDDALYDIVVVIGHNDDPVVPGAGSAVFMHLARADGGPTEGCVGLARGDLRDLLAACAPGDALRIG
jgi:L,D-peptidoglycan transpeptidase YkuD (ErfK/YbiS/YcfS/YnhG family)